jgi:hypothetical protein
MGTNTETQSRAHPVSFENIKTNLHFASHMSFGSFNTCNAFANPCSAEADDGGLADISSLKGLRLQEREDSNTTTLATGRADTSQCQEHAATPKSAVGMYPSEAKNPTEPHTVVDNDPPPEHGATHEPNANVSSLPAPAQKDEKSTEQVKLSTADLPPDDVV